MVVISGPPASGKTTLAHSISESAGVSVFSKDETDRANVPSGFVRQQRYGPNRLRSLVSLTLETTGAVIIEGDFVPWLDRKWVSTLAEDETEVREFFVYTRGFTSFHRFVRRNESGQRPAYHHDRQWYPGMALYGCFRSLGLFWPWGRLFPGRCLDVWSSDEAWEPPLAEVVHRASEFLQTGRIDWSG